MFSFSQTSDSTVDHKGDSSRTLFLLEQFGNDGFISQMTISNDNEIGTPVTINPTELIEALSTATTLTANTQDPRILVMEIKLFWQRSNYFLALNAALVLGFFRLNEGYYGFALACFGLLVSFLWYQVNLGSKYSGSRIGKNDLGFKSKRLRHI